MPNDQKREKIIDAIKSKSYPITAAYIASLTEIEKSKVNSALYKMQKDEEVKKYECIPPLWGVSDE